MSASEQNCKSSWPLRCIRSVDVCVGSIVSVCSIVSDVVALFATPIRPCDQLVSMRHNMVTLQYAEICRGSDALSSHLGMSAMQTRATGQGQENKNLCCTSMTSNRRLASGSLQSEPTVTDVTLDSSLSLMSSVSWPFPAPPADALHELLCVRLSVSSL